MLGPSYFISIVLGSLNSLVWYVSSSRYMELGSYFVSARTNIRHFHHNDICAPGRAGPEVPSRWIEVLWGQLRILLGPLSCDGNPLVDMRTGARHADVRLGGLWNRQCLEEDEKRRTRRWFTKY